MTDDISVTVSTKDETPEQNAARLKRRAENYTRAGVTGDLTRTLPELTLHDIMRVEAYEASVELIEDGEVTPHVIGIKNGEVTYAVLRFIDSKEWAMMMLNLQVKHQFERLVFVAEAWLAPDSRTDAERNRGVPIRPPAEREDRKECIAVAGWEWGLFPELSMSWVFDRNAEGKAVMDGTMGRMADHAVRTPISRIAVLERLRFEKEKSATGGTN